MPGRRRRGAHWARQLQVEIRRLRTRRSFSELVALRIADILVLGAQLVRFSPRGRAGRGVSRVIRRLHGVGGRRRPNENRLVHRGRVRNRLVHAFHQNQDVLEPARHAAGIDQNLLERLRAAHRLHHAHGKPARENTVVAGGVKPFAGFHLLFERHIVHPADGRSLPLERAVHQPFLRDHPRRKIRVGDQQHRRCRGVRRNHLAHDSVRRHHRHSAFHARHRAAIHKHHFGIRARADHDDRGRHRLGGRARLKHRQRLGAVRHAELVLQINVVQLEAADFGLKPAVFLVRVVQQHVVADEARAAAAQSFDDARHGCDRGHRPDADHAHVPIVLDLKRDQDKLRQDRQQQDGDAPVPVEKRLHAPGPPSVPSLSKSAAAA